LRAESNCPTGLERSTLALTQTSDKHP
jgi:hypothetical protein